MRTATFTRTVTPDPRVLVPEAKIVLRNMATASLVALLLRRARPLRPGLLHPGLLLPPPLQRQRSELCLESPGSSIRDDSIV
jgi:hypothetical protein